MKKQLNKKICSRIHFKKRMEERMDMVINRHDIREIVNCIQNSDNVIKSTKLTSRLSSHLLLFRGKKCNILYDRSRKTPVTVLHENEEYISYSGITCSRDKQLLRI